MILSNGRNVSTKKKKRTNRKSISFQKIAVKIFFPMCMQLNKMLTILCAIVVFRSHFHKLRLFNNAPEPKSKLYIKKWLFIHIKTFFVWILIRSDRERRKQIRVCLGSVLISLVFIPFLSYFFSRTRIQVKENYMKIKKNHIYIYLLYCVFLFCALATSANKL